MYRLSDEELSTKIQEAYKSHNYVDVSMKTAEKDGKPIGMEMRFETSIGNIKAEENKLLLKSLKEDLKIIFGKVFRQEENAFGTAEFVTVFGTMP